MSSWLEKIYDGITSIVGGASSEQVVSAIEASAIPPENAFRIGGDALLIGDDDTQTRHTPHFLKITASAANATELIAAASGIKYRVISWIVTESAAVNFKFQSGATDIAGLFYKDAGGSFSPLGHFETAAGEALNIHLSGAVAVGGYLVYIEV